MKFSPEEEVMVAELRKGMGSNAKLSHWVGTFSKASDVVRHATFVAFWLCKFVFGFHPHYVVKPLYFQLALKISAEVSLPVPGSPVCVIRYFAE